MVYEKFLSCLPKSERTAFRIILDTLSTTPSGGKTEQEMGTVVTYKQRGRVLKLECVQYSRSHSQYYWQIGRLIIKEEQRGKTRAVYGKGLIKELSIKLSTEFGRGFDKSNLWNMRAFFLCFPKIDALRRELSWTHYRLLLWSLYRLTIQLYGMKIHYEYFSRNIIIQDTGRNISSPFWNSYSRIAYAGD